MWSGWCHASCTCGWEITIIFFYACTAVAITISGWLSYDFDLCYSAMLCFGFNFFASPKWNEEQEKYEEKKKESAFWNVAADVRVVSQSHLESKIERLFSRCFFCCCWFVCEDRFVWHTIEIHHGPRAEAWNCMKVPQTLTGVINQRD